jgi:hypothetical protein
MPHRVDEGPGGRAETGGGRAQVGRHPVRSSAGSFAVYAHGGHSSDHDVDFLIRERDKERILEVLAEAGFTVKQPPRTGWSRCSTTTAGLADLIYRPVEAPVTDETLHDTEQLSVESIFMPVASATQLMIHKLLSYTQHYCDFATGLPIARSLREKIDWDRVREETAKSPYAEAFLVLLDRLDVVPLPGDARSHIGG